MGNNSLARYGFCLLGALSGGALGYLYRPPAPLIGQLPFMHVLTRGTRLKGFDQILIPIAEKSFNYVVAGALIGVALGCLLKRVLETRKPS